MKGRDERDEKREKARERERESLSSITIEMFGLVYILTSINLAVARLKR